ncbi:hypothetical protein DPMN_046769 [Dreissena polymorpha]|uniref:Uncharacterized protein n=1 Tax=Dreissena polymorpha TaxID=45954 RepID=A0A9D4D8M1_DREPO|nr:hypothetical protein DPMN_046769 [Dreissena polymorpha]
MSSRLITCFHYIHIEKTAPLPCAHVFPLITTIFKLIQTIFELNCRIQIKFPAPWRTYIYGINLLTKFNKDRTINVASRVKNAQPLGSHVFQAKITIFALIQDIIGTNLLSNFYDDRKINVTSKVKNAPPPDGHVFQPTSFIF